MRPLQVCIDARLPGGRCGGTEQVVIGLAAGLSWLTDGEERYLFLTHAEQDEWLLPYMNGSCTILRGERLRHWSVSRDGSQAVSSKPEF